MTKKPMPHPDLTTEVCMGFLLSKTIIGVDEVGRGCLAGPVVAAAAILYHDSIQRLKFTPTGKRSREKRGVKKEDSQGESNQTRSELELLLSVRDSKLVPDLDRTPLAESVKRFVRGYALGEASVLEIEKLNILYASHLAMERAVEALEASLGFRADFVLVDGHMVPRVFLGRGYPLIKGDQKSMTIACASIIAKVYRDQMMAELDVAYPGYGLGEHKGYSTPQHKRAIVALGATDIHRRHFRGVLPEAESTETFSFMDDLVES
jgi:ribonuclease HII